MTERNDDWLDRQLREDAGFTSRVLGALPARAAYPWLRTALIVGSTALGGLLATLFAPVGPMALEGVRELVHFKGFTPSIAMTLAMVTVLAVAGWVLATDD